MLLSATMFNPLNLMESFLAPCVIDQGRALTFTFHFTLLGCRLFQILRGNAFEYGWP